ncbi:MAG: hypothetical protein FJ207_00845 [Gemmatimonadetes bacterium]|nr:hypothetical protein [Gemmatimonadota bacterium]
MPGLYYTPTSVAAGGVAFDPVGVGTATVTARSTGLVAQPLATQTVTVSAPGISVGPATVGAGLQAGNSLSLGSTNHGGVTVTITSSDSTTLLVSPSATTPGTRSISYAFSAGQSGVSFFVQGVEGATGAATLTVTAAGFLDGTSTVTVVRPGLIISQLATSIGSTAVNDHFYAYVGLPSGTTVSTQNVRAGSPGITVTATSGNASVAQIATSTGVGSSRTAVIVPGLYYTPVSLATGGFELDPLAAGTTTVSVAAPGITTQPLGTQVVTITP